MNVFTESQLAPEPWTRDALCAQVGGDVFFPEPNDRHAADAAKRICARCPVIAQCRDYAARTRPTDGIWGGLTAKTIRGRDAA